MTTPQSLYQFDAQIKSLGQQRSGDGWDLVLGWKLPGSKFDLHLYGQEWQDVSDYKVGQSHNWTIQQGNLKNDKNGNYSSDYYWDWVPRGTKPQEIISSPLTYERVPDGAQNPAAIGSCANHAVDFIARSVIPIPEGIDPLMFARQLRDRFYWEVNQVPVAPAHYCYQHETAHQQGKSGAWGHMVGDAPCLEVPIDAPAVVESDTQASEAPGQPEDTEPLF
jgi:hypothetical protein